MTVEFSSKSPAVAVLPIKESEKSFSHQVNGAQEKVELAVKAVRRATNAIEELVTYGQTISDVSERGVAHYREAASAAIARAESLEQERSLLRQELSSLKNASAARIDELEAQVEALKEELESMRVLIWPRRSL